MEDCTDEDTRKREWTMHPLLKGIDSKRSTFFYVVWRRLIVNFKGRLYLLID
jgi:hypothetical protein